MDFLDPISNLALRLDERKFSTLAQPSANNNGSVIVAHTGKRGPRNAAYSCDHGCPTITSGDITIYDRRIDCYRKLSLSEKCRISGFGNYTFGDLVGIGRRHGLIGRSMDRKSVISILEDVSRYLLPMPDHVIPPVISCLSTMEMHEATGHPGKQLSSAMGIPHPSHCEFCEQGNRKKASSTAGIKPLSINFGQRMHVDFKISSISDCDGCTVMMGATCEHTNWQETYPMQQRSEVLHVMRKLKADIASLGGHIQTIVTDNDSVFTSKQFQQFLVEDPSHLMTMSLCPSHHHEYAGRQESRWRLLKSIATKGIARLALVIGDDAEKYWSHAYSFAKEVMNRRKFKRHGSDVYEISPYEQV